MEDADFDRVAYYDPSYQTGWVHDPEGIARLLVQRHGFIVLDAGRLAAWMKAVTARDPSKTVCVLLQGLVPDTIAERKSRACTARRYLDAGGRLVSVGDVPFYQIGDSRGGRKEWGDAGHEAVLGVRHVWGDTGEAAVTEAGRAWGLEPLDTGIRCSAPEEVTPLRTVRGRHSGAVALASTWHKVYNGRHPLQGFLRYRGGAFEGKHWNAQVNELARLALRGFEEPFAAPDSWRDAASEALPRVVFNDPRYPALESKDPQASVARLVAAHGFAALDADRLRAWMRAQVAAGAAGSVAVLLHGAAPETVFDDVSPQCLARRYMDSGGRLVWAGDIPFYYRGLPNGSSAFHNDVGTAEAVLDIPVRAPGEVPAPPAVTDAGKAWGLKSADEARRFADAACVTEVLAGAGAFASSWLKTFARDVPGSGFLCFRNGPFEPGLADELASVALHALPARAAAAAPLAVDVEGERTGGGGFVVDRERALQKLMKFMLPSPELFLQPLARVAAASGAKTFKLGRAGRDIVVEFDGAPLPVKALRDPFAAVTEESPDPRLRAWGLAILTALRAGKISVASAGNGATIASVDDVAPFAVGVSGGTSFRLVRPSWRFPSLGALKAGLAARAPGFAEQLSARGRRPAPAELQFDDGVVKGCLRVPAEPRVASNLLVCVQGVGAATVSFVLQGAAPVEGWVNDDRLGLNASLNGVVRDERLAALRAVIDGQLARLLSDALTRADALAAGRAARLARPGMAALWARHLGAVPGRLAGAWGALARTAVRDALEEELVEEARLVRWLRQSAAGRLSSLDGDKNDPVRAALWKAPLFTAVDGAPLSLEALELARRRDGRVPVASEFGAVATDGRLTAWAPPGRETNELRRTFGDEVAPLARPKRRFGAEPAGLLERAGLQDFLVRVPIENGEVGLRVEPEPRHVLRVRGVKNGRAESFHLHPCGLRVDAAVEGTADAGSALVAAAAFDPLYRLLTSSFSCPVSRGFLGGLKRAFRIGQPADPEKREEAALSHLRDYLAVSLEAGGPLWPRGVPLFESSAGWLSLDALEAALERDGILLWVDKGSVGALNGLGLTAVFGRGLGDGLMGKLFKGRQGLERHSLDRVYTSVWLTAPRRPACSHRAPFGCLAEGKLDGADVHLAVSEKGEVLLYPVPAGEPRAVRLEAAGRLAYDAALAAALRAPQCLEPGTHPWRDFVLSVAARDLSPWPGKPGAGALRALLFSRLTFQGRWGVSSLDGLRGAMSSDHPLVYTQPGGAFDPAYHALGAAELSLLRALWPQRADRLMSVEEFWRYSKALAVEKSLTTEAHSRARAAARPAAAPPTRGKRAGDLPSVMREVGGACGSWSVGARFTFTGAKGKRLVLESGGNDYEVRDGHPAARTVLDSSLASEAKTAYLASLAHTAVNRLKGAVTDKDDTLFQAALAAWAAEG